MERERKLSWQHWVLPATPLPCPQSLFFSGPTLTISPVLLYLHSCCKRASYIQLHRKTKVSPHSSPVVPSCALECRLSPPFRACLTLVTPLSPLHCVFLSHLYICSGLSCLKDKSSLACANLSLSLLFQVSGEASPVHDALLCFFHSFPSPLQPGFQTSLVAATLGF